MNLSNFTGPVVLVPARRGAPATGEVFIANPDVVRRNRWIAVSYNGKRIAKVAPGPTADAEIDGIISGIRNAQAATVAEHNAKFGAAAIYDASHETPEVTGENVSEESAEESVTEVSDETGAEIVEAAGENASEESAPLSDTQTEAPAPVRSSITRRPSRPRKPAAKK